jgi:very-short-patch-repair endonuclease
VTKAVQRRLTTPEALSRALQRRTRIRHRKLIGELLADVASGVHSALEHRYLHDVERAHGLPKPSRQASRPGKGVFVDVLYREFALIVELDGRIGHVEEGRWRDRRRDNMHAASGALTLRFGWHEVTREPCAVALDVAEVLIGRGWTGYPAKCPRCQ